MNKHLSKFQTSIPTGGFPPIFICEKTSDSLPLSTDVIKREFKSVTNAPSMMELLRKYQQKEK